MKLLSRRPRVWVPSLISALDASGTLRRPPGRSGSAWTRIALPVLPAIAVWLLVSPSAAANHVPGATYTGIAGTEGTVELDVSADGNSVTRFATQGVLTTCGELTHTRTVSTPITNHSFDSGNSRPLQFEGNFAPGAAGGTLRHVITGFPGCTSDDVTWTASVSPPPPDGTPPPDGGPPLTLDLEAKKQKLRKKIKVFATATVTSTLVVEGKKIKDTTTDLVANQETKLKAKLTRKARNRLEEKLDDKGKAKVKVAGTATTQSGAEATDAVKVKLKD